MCVRGGFVLAALAITACGGGGGNTNAGAGTYPTTPTTPNVPAGTVPANTMIATKGLTFNPLSLNVARNTTVTFVIEDSTHTLYFSGAGAPQELPQAQNQSVQRTFSNAGTFTVLCRNHSYMYSTITVAP